MGNDAERWRCPTCGRKATPGMYCLACVRIRVPLLDEIQALEAEVERLSVAATVLQKLDEARAFDFFEDRTMVSADISNGDDMVWIRLTDAEYAYLAAVAGTETPDAR